LSFNIVRLIRFYKEINSSIQSNAEIIAGNVLMIVNRNVLNGFSIAETRRKKGDKTIVMAHFSFSVMSSEQWQLRETLTNRK